MTQQLFNLEGLNLYVNPFTQRPGELLRAVNVVPEPYGALTKRDGYAEFLGAANEGTVQNLFAVSYNAGAQTYLYRKSEEVLYYYDLTAGTGDWTVCGNGTFAGTSYLGHAVLEDTLIVGDGIGSTRHTTNGTSFTNTTGAPIARDFEQYQQRIYASGTADTLFFSTTGTPTDWSGAAPSDSSSIQIPGEGDILRIKKINDVLHVFKRGGNIFQWDGDRLIDKATDSGISYPLTIDKMEDYAVWLNYKGMYGSGGGRPELLSNAVGEYFKDMTAGTPTGITHELNYFVSPQTLVDPQTGGTITNGGLRYDIQKNIFHAFSLWHTPTAWGVYEDNDGKQQLIFGNEDGQVFKFASTLKSDNGDPINSVIELLLHGGQPEDRKMWQELTLFFNPGSRAKVQVGFMDTFNRDGLKLVDLGDTSSGFVHFRIPQGTESNLMFLRIYENSESAKYTCYGGAVTFDVRTRR